MAKDFNDIAEQAEQLHIDLMNAKENDNLFSTTTRQDDEGRDVEYRVADENAAEAVKSALSFIQRIESDLRELRAQSPFDGQNTEFILNRP